MWIDFAGQFQKSLTALPLKTYQAGERVLANGSRTNELLILRNGNVAVVKEGVEVARVTEPGAVFGEISALLDCPHTADVRALTSSQFHVAHPAALQDPVALFYVAAILARRLDRTNQALVELTSQIQVDEPRSVIERTIEKMKRLLVAAVPISAMSGIPTIGSGKKVSAASNRRRAHRTQATPQDISPAKRGVPLPPEGRHSAVQKQMSALGHKRTSGRL
jgi:CRP/FNR family transcriptional regulator, cyclic AMP receptor protein